MKKHLKKMQKNVLEFTKAGMTTSVGSSVLTTAGSPLGAAGLGSMASYYPAMGSMMGGSTALNMMGELKPKKKSKKK